MAYKRRRESQGKGEVECGVPGQTERKASFALGSVQSVRGTGCVGALVCSAQVLRLSMWGRGRTINLLVWQVWPRSVWNE